MGGFLMRINTWNIPLMIISMIEEILNIKRKKTSINYLEWIDSLSRMKLTQKDIEINILLDRCFELLNDKRIDYHIMTLENLLTINEEDNPMISLEDRYNKIINDINFENYRNKYKTDINKKKNLFIECIKYVSVMQSSNLLVLKYRPEVTFYDLWNEFYMETRGVVIDLYEMKLVSAPYRKFFNLNEKPITDIDRVLKLMSKANKVIIKNKEDGSMISCSKYKDDLVVSTPGSLDSDQAIWSKKFLNEHYPDLVTKMPSDLTFIFEAIYPDNRIVVDYKGKENLILTNIRNNLTGRLLSEELVEQYAKEYNFQIPEKETTGLLELMEKAKDRELYPASEKEGWVFVIKTDEEELLFKLKCDDYCELHKIMSFASSPKIIFNAIKEGNIDDMLSKIPKEFKDIPLKVANIVYNHIYKVEAEVKNILDKIPTNICYTQKEVETYLDFLKFIEEKIVSALNPKLAKNIHTEIIQAIKNRSFNKTVIADKWVMKEIDNMWNLIPDKLKDNKDFRRKQGQLIGYIKKDILPKYQNIAFCYVEFRPYNIIDTINLKDIDFSQVTQELNKFDE